AFSMRSAFLCGNAERRMTAMRNRNPVESEMPPLGVGDEEVTEHLDARNRFEFFGVNKIGIECERVGLTEQLYQAAVFFHQIVRQSRDTKPALARTEDAEHVVHRQMRCAWSFAITADLKKPPPILQVRWHHTSAKENNAMPVELFVCSRRP